ncbi:MAG: molybdopterin-dependent oxidoreductase [Chloroflexi bacterium]|nr:molybdopterin-dependent oxidoreductase [Chloroflexota bacterium]
MESETQSASNAGVRVGMVLGGLTSFAYMAVNYLGQVLFGLPFFPFDVFDWMGRTLPGGLVTAGIDSIVFVVNLIDVGQLDRSAKFAENLLAIILFATVGVLLGALLGIYLRRDEKQSMRAGLAIGLILALPILLIEASLSFSSLALAEILWTLLSIAAWGGVVAELIQRAGQMAGRPTDLNQSRRSFLYLVGGSVTAFSLGTVGLTKLLGGEDEPFSALPSTNVDMRDTSGVAASPAKEVLEARIDAVLGTRPEVTTNEAFYTIDINSVPRQVDEETWRLEVGGLVLNPLSLSLQEIRDRPSISQFITLQCISNPIGGSLTGTSKWKGVRFADLMQEAGLLPQAQALFIESEDGFFETVSLEDLLDERTLLVYEMNDEPLPAAHGFPLRIYIPNRYGMKQPKWIARITAIDNEGRGYWVERGWSIEARPVTVSVIDVVDDSGDLVEGEPIGVGGIAYAGARGISKVEIQINDGPWEVAQLREPPLSPLTWVQWRYDWPYSPGRYTLNVRAYDASGILQQTMKRGVRPDGATGVHSLKVNI